MSCCLGARLANSIIRALNLPGIKVIYWSDSKVALWWIRERGNWSVFVATGVHVEERELSELSSDDIENAERVLIRLVQDKMFPNLKSIPIVNVFKDNDGIIRVKTKITERKDYPNFIAPILMPSKCL
ncbi:integrase_H2C2 domain-containing protein [Trichonephila clavipes]|nr:integrase_H2C2 domain-containing protein [Trichonephila clavipes]